MEVGQIMRRSRSFMEREYRLVGKPFARLIGIPLELQAWVNRQKQVDRWNKVIEDALDTPTANFLALIIGDYGMGKTLALFKIVDEAPAKDTYPLYITLVSEEKPKSPGLDFVLRIIRSVDFKKLKVSRRDISLLGEVFPEVGKVFGKILYPKSEDEESLAAAFVRGQIRPTQTQLRSIGILRRIGDVDTAKEYLIGTLYVLKASGYRTLVVSVDEFEYLFSLVPPSSQSVYLALLRGLHDLPAAFPTRIKDKVANMVLFMAISEDGLRRLTELEKVEQATGGPIQPLARRISARIRLEALSKSFVRELIEKRLSLNRVKGKYEREPLIPFTESFVEYVFKLSRGKPSDVIDRCDHVLDLGLARRIHRLTPEFAVEVFKERGLTY